MRYYPITEYGSFLRFTADENGERPTKTDSAYKEDKDVDSDTTSRWSIMKQMDDEPQTTSIVRYQHISRS